MVGAITQAINSPGGISPCARPIDKSLVENFLIQHAQDHGILHTRSNNSNLFCFTFARRADALLRKHIRPGQRFGNYIHLDGPHTIENLVETLSNLELCFGNKALINRYPDGTHSKQECQTMLIAELPKICAHRGLAYRDGKLYRSFARCIADYPDDIGGLCSIKTFPSKYHLANNNHGSLRTRILKTRNCNDSEGILNSWQALGIPIASEREETDFVCRFPDGITPKSDFSQILKNKLRDLQTKYNLIPVPGQQDTYSIDFLTKSVSSLLRERIGPERTTRNQIRYYPSPQFTRVALGTHPCDSSTISALISRANFVNYCKLLGVTILDGKRARDFVLQYPDGKHQCDYFRELIDKNWDVLEAAGVQRDLVNDTNGYHFKYYLHDASSLKLLSSKLSLENGRKITCKTFPSTQFIQAAVPGRYGHLNSLEDLKSAWRALGLEIASPEEEQEYILRHPDGEHNKSFILDLINQNWDKFKKLGIKRENIDGEYHYYFATGIKLKSKLILNTGQDFYSMFDNNFLKLLRRGDNLNNYTVPINTEKDLIRVFQALGAKCHHAPIKQKRAIENQVSNNPKADLILKNFARAIHQLVAESPESQLISFDPDGTPPTIKHWGIDYKDKKLFVTYILPTTQGFSGNINLLLNARTAQEIQEAEAAKQIVIFAIVDTEKANPGVEELLMDAIQTNSNSPVRFIRYNPQQTNCSVVNLTTAQPNYELPKGASSLSKQSSKIYKALFAAFRYPDLREDSLKTYLKRYRLQAIADYKPYLTQPWETFFKDTSDLVVDPVVDGVHFDFSYIKDGVQYYADINPCIGKLYKSRFSAAKAKFVKAKDCAYHIINVKPDKNFCRLNHVHEIIDLENLDQKYLTHTYHYQLAT